VPGRVVFNQERCKGCELCTTVCPPKIVVMQETRNSHGYRPATVLDMAKCTGCALCAQVCPDVVIEVYRTAPAAARTASTAGETGEGWGC